jgi:aspartyl-tRNA(Asn)/glutamyl-tRNA(Gln) amidotransferase subunit A
MTSDRTPTDLTRASAVDLSTLYRDGQVSPVETATAVLDRIEAVNPVLNCFCLIDRDTTLAQARESEARWQAGTPLSPLDGIPVSIKDLTLTAGWPTLRGSRTVDPEQDWNEDSPPVARLREAGAVLSGKTTTPEFGWKGVTDNTLTGITRNPWDPTRTPGGSSGGAAAACAAFLGPLHQGSDAAGSVRIPAAFTGVFGHKPTFGIVPQYPLPGHIGNLANFGPLTRSVEDGVLLLNAMAAKRDARDPFAPPMQGRDWGLALDDGIEGLRVAWSPTLGQWGWADPDVMARVEAAVKTLAGLGAIVEEADPDIPDPTPIINVMWEAAVAWMVETMPPAKRDLMDPKLVALGAKGSRYKVTDLVGAQATRLALSVAMSRFHETYDLLITPQMPLEAFAAGSLTPPGREAELPDFVSWTPFTYPFNLTMQPAASVPCGFGASGMPVAFQIVGRHFEDALVLRAARAYEAAHPFAMPEDARYA